MRYCSHRWVKKAFAFPQPKYKSKKETWEQMSSRDLDIFTPPHPELRIRQCLCSHQPFVQAQHEHLEMSAA